MTNGMQAYDPEIAKRLEALSGFADARPSTGGYSPTVYQIGKMGGFEDTGSPDLPPRQEILIVPVMLRETRAYWARSGFGDQPDCRSINGIEPVKGEDTEPQAEKCGTCPWNAFGTAEKGRGKKCKTKAVLFGLEVSSEGKITGGVVFRFSVANRDVNHAIVSADKAAAEQGLRRFLGLWRCKTTLVKAKGKGGVDYIYFNPIFAGPAPRGSEGAILDCLETLGPKGFADKFITGVRDQGDGAAAE